MLGLVQSVSLGRITAHSGGTDEYGCHSGSQAYHCHPKTSSNFDQRKYYKINGLQSNGVFKIPSVRFSSCVHLNRRFLRGVSGKRVKNQDQALLFSKKLYAMNRHLDLDKDGVACGLLEPENARVLTLICDSAGIPSGDGTSPQNSYKCIMEPRPSGDLGSGWRIEILSKTPDAQLVIRSEMPNDPMPVAGKQYYLMSLKVTNLTGSPKMFEAFRLKVAGPSGQFYDLDNRCGSGILPNWLLAHGLVQPTKSIFGNMCWEILSSDAENLRLAYESSTYCNCNMYSWIKKFAFVAP